MNCNRGLLSGLALALGCCFTPVQAEPDWGDSPKALSQRSARWWQWALSIPAANNPLTDTTGANCGVGQPGDVWFLAGSWFGGHAVRTCNVPHGVPIFFPVVNSVWVTIADCGDDPSTPIADLRAGRALRIDGATGLQVLLDNRGVPNLRRVKSDVFSVRLPRGDLFGAVGDCAVAGRPYGPSVDDGYYVTLHGLGEGTHHLSIRGQTGGPRPSLVDVFYTLNVVKK